MSGLFGKTKVPEVEPIDPGEDARKLRLRLAGRGGHQSTLLTANKDTQGSIFKRNLGGSNA